MTTTNSRMDSLIESLLSAQKVSEVTEWIENTNLAWVPVGNNPNNLATINVGSDPAAGVIERVTNAFDSVLERAWVERGKPTGIRSPRQASEEWFSLPEGTLANIEDTRNVTDLAKNVRVKLLESDSKDKPTVEVRDQGIGLRSEHFSDTILSLQGSNKINKLFLAGAFGQGGSTALSYSPYTIIVSRRFSPDSELHSVAATVVRFNRGDLERDKHGYYEYAVDAQTGNPLTFSVSESDFPVGTLVRHVAMDIGKFKAVMTAPTSSLWYLGHHYLFDPVLPFRAEDHRTGSPTNRTITGNRRRLTKGAGIQYQNSAKLTFQAGTVGINWWVLSDEDGSSISNYVWKSKPIVITYNGQKQGYLSNGVIKKDLQLPYLERHIVVHVDCDQLDNESRRQLFSTTRESLRDSPIMDGLRQLVIDTLSGDPALRELDRERKLRFLDKTDSESVDKIRKRLASRVKTFVSASEKVGGASDSSSDGGGSGDLNPREPIPVSEPPTFIRITNPSPRRVHPGKRFALQFETDAQPSYFSSPDTFLAALIPATTGVFSGRTHVKNGYGTVYFDVQPDSEPGDLATSVLEVRPKGTVSLRAEIDIEVVAPPEASGSNGQASTPNINPIFVGEGDEFYKEQNWDKSSVATVIRTDESVDIYVSSANSNLERLIRRAQRVGGESSVEGVKNFYLEHIAFHSMLASLGYGSVETVDSEAEGGEEVPPTEESRTLTPEEAEAEEMKRVCETVTGVMAEMFDTIFH